MLISFIQIFLLFLQIPTHQQIIDEHYNAEYQYYRRVCRRYYKGRYLFEDLLHELYFGLLKVPEDVVIKYKETNTLRILGFRTIRNIYQRRDQQKRIGDSVLMEIKNIGRDSDKSDLYTEQGDEKIISDGDPFYNIGTEDPTFDDEMERLKDERRLDTLNALITANRNNEKIQLLLMCENQTIVDVAKQMNTSVYLVRKELNEIKQTLKDHIL